MVHCRLFTKARVPSARIARHGARSRKAISPTKAGPARAILPTPGPPPSGGKQTESTPGPGGAQGHRPMRLPGAPGSWTNQDEPMNAGHCAARKAAVTPTAHRYSTRRPSLGQSSRTSPTNRTVRASATRDPAPAAATRDGTRRCRVRGAIDDQDAMDCSHSSSAPRAAAPERTAR